MKLNFYVDVDCSGHDVMVVEFSRMDDDDKIVVAGSLMDLMLGQCKVGERNA